MIFKQLNPGDKFRFVRKTGVGCGMFNGIGTKVDKQGNYTMGGISHRIGNFKLEVIKVDENGKD